MSKRKLPPGNFLYHSDCTAEDCRSSDAKAHYDNGTAYCFSCGTYFKGEGVEETETKVKDNKFIRGSYQDIPNRKLREEVCSKFGYEIGEIDGAPCHIANYKDPQTGRVIAQKIRKANKKFTIIGPGKGLPFFGQHLYSGGKWLVITEGEIDALSVAQAMSNGKWPVVSLPNGASSAVDTITAQLEWLDTFDGIVLCFDQDQPGREATEAALPLLPAGKAYTMVLPHKDANETLIEDGAQAITSAFWNAQPWRPDGVRKLSDILEEAKKPIEIGLPWCFPTMTKGTYGRREGEVYTFGAGTGVGKTDFFTQQAVYDAMELQEPIGLFFLEQQNTETARRLAGKFKGKAFHIPDDSWTPEEYEIAIDELAATDRIFLYNHFGQSDLDVIVTRIRYLARVFGVRLFYIDNLTSLADPSKERESLETAMGVIASLAQELKIIIHLLSHLATPDGKSHEEGGRVELRHFKGARAIGFWTFFAFGFERNKGHEDPEIRNLMTVRCVKDRYTGRMDGEVFYIRYDKDTCMLTECEAPDTFDDLDV